ncbi:unnamed protein product [Rhizophagus irregularis]|nr:unnamed protein product [Rhizophagus irregularis]
MPNNYTRNPLTGRVIRIGRNTFNQLVMDAYDFIGGRENPQNAGNRLEQMAVERRGYILEEFHRARLEQINLELCRECLMPENPNELQKDKEYRMTNQNDSIGRTHCSTCGHIIAKTKKGLSGVEFRRIVREITQKEDLNNSKDRLIKIIRHASLNVDFTNAFTEVLDNKIRGNENIENIQNWLIDQISITGKDSGERFLYQYLYDVYSEGIDGSFSDFYEGYAFHCADSPMTKNMVSRALGAIGLKPKMMKIDFEGRRKSAIVIKASADELYEALRRSGY